MPYTLELLRGDSFSHKLKRYLKGVPQVTRNDHHAYLSTLTYKDPESENVQLPLFAVTGEADANEQPEDTDTDTESTEHTVIPDIDYAPGDYVEFDIPNKFYGGLPVKGLSFDRIVTLTGNVPYHFPLPVDVAELISINGGFGSRYGGLQLLGSDVTLNYDANGETIQMVMYKDGTDLRVISSHDQTPQPWKFWLEYTRLPSSVPS